MAISIASDPVSRSLADAADELVERQLLVLQAHPRYEQLRELDLRSSARRNVERTLAAMNPGYDCAETDDVTSTVLHVIPDLDPQDVVNAYRAAMGVIRDAYIEFAGRAHLPAERTVAGLRRIWDLTDSYSELIAAAHGRITIDGRPGHRERARYLRHALEGELSDSELELGAAQLGLAPDTPLRVIRIHVDGLVTQRLMRQLEDCVLGSLGEPLVTRVDGDLAGLVAVLPHDLGEDGCTAALSEPVLLRNLHAGYLRASQILTTAQRFGLTGVVDAADLGLRPAILAVPATSEALYARYVQQVRASTPMAAELLHTVDTFLKCQRRFQRTADVLNMHVNSLRHRLERYRELTGADLADTETITEVWWSLEYGRALGALA
jgi:hypothetical protein